MSYYFTIAMAVYVFMGFKAGSIGATGLCVMFGAMAIISCLLFISNEWLELAKIVVDGANAVIK